MRGDRTDPKKIYVRSVSNIFLERLESPQSSNVLLQESFVFVANFTGQLYANQTHVRSHNFRVNADLEASFFDVLATS